MLVASTEAKVDEALGIQKNSMSESIIDHNNGIPADLLKKSEDAFTRSASAHESGDAKDHKKSADEHSDLAQDFLFHIKKRFGEEGYNLAQRYVQHHVGYMEHSREHNRLKRK